MSWILSNILKIWKLTWHGPCLQEIRVEGEAEEGVTMIWKVQCSAQIKKESQQNLTLPLLSWCLKVNKMVGLSYDYWARFHGGLFVFFSGCLLLEGTEMHMAEKAWESSKGLDYIWQRVEEALMSRVQCGHHSLSVRHWVSQCPRL